MVLLKDRDWQVLLRSIQRGHCILLLGPGVVIDPNDPQGDPLPVRLALKLAEELREENKGDELITPSDLAHVAQVYARAMPKKRPGLELAVEDFYAPYRQKTTPLHLDLAALPFTLCISTTPERFLRNAFAQTQGKKPIYDFYHFLPDPSRARARILTEPPEQNPENRPLIYDLYGSLNEPDSLILSENDLLDFLVKVIREPSGLNLHVTKRFSDPSTSFLFIGFGFRHWYIRILLHVLKASSERRGPSMALEDASFFNLPDHQQTVLFFRSGHLIDFYYLPWRDFARELHERYQRQITSERSRLAMPELPANAPIVFLCHENRDKPRAESLAEQLQARGIRIWLDKQSLRGGDRWSILIHDVLEKQSHYVVVLQSPRMLDKPESYFFLEIDLALKRLSKFKPGLRYLIPTILEPDPCLPLPNLAHLHMIDLTAPGGVDDLARDIREDWQERQAVGGT